MDRIDEQSRRKPGWTAGGSVVLADGQAWHFPRVRMVLWPGEDGADGKPSIGTGRAANGTELPRYGDWFGVLTSRQVPGDVWWGTRMDAAATMLRLNYDLAIPELRAILTWREGDDASERMWGEIDCAVLGIAAPKAGSAG